MIEMMASDDSIGYAERDDSAKKHAPQPMTFYSIDALKGYLNNIPDGQSVRVTIEFEDDVNLHSNRR